MNPAHPLAARAHRPTETQTEDGQHLAEGATIGAQHDADAQLHQPASSWNLISGRLPALADLGQKIAPGWAGLAEARLRTGAVETHG